MLLNRKELKRDPNINIYDKEKILNQIRRQWLNRWTEDGNKYAKRISRIERTYPWGDVSVHRRLQEDGEWYEKQSRSTRNNRATVQRDIVVLLNRDR